MGRLGEFLDGKDGGYLVDRRDGGVLVWDCCCMGLVDGLLMRVMGMPEQDWRSGKSLRV